MYFKINKSGCSEHDGLIQIRYDLFFDPGEYGYNQFYFEVPIFPEGGYPGVVNKDGSPADLDDYKKWVDGLPKEWRNNAFCWHMCQFKPPVTDEEILYIGELALKMQFDNFRANGNLKKPINQPVFYSNNTTQKATCKTRVAEILNTDFTAVKVESEKPYSVRA